MQDNVNEKAEILREIGGCELSRGRFLLIETGQERGGHGRGVAYLLLWACGGEGQRPRMWKRCPLIRNRRHPNSTKFPPGERKRSRSRTLTWRAEGLNSKKKRMKNGAQEVYVGERKKGRVR